MLNCMTDMPRGSGRPDNDRLTRLVGGAADGDRESFGLLYDAVSPVVYGISRRVLRDENMAAENTQEVMLELWSRSGTYNPRRGTVYAWAATVAHRRAVDVVRSESSRRDREHRTHRETLPVDAVDDGILQSEEAAQVRHCLGALTDLEKESLTAAYYGGRTYSEVARHLSAPLATVKSRIRSALSRMRTCMEKS